MKSLICSETVSDCKTQTERASALRFEGTFFIWPRLQEVLEITEFKKNPLVGSSIS